MLQHTQQQEALFNYANYVGNAERKTLLGAMALANESTVFDANTLTEEYRDDHLGHEVWKLNPTDCEDFIQRGLIPGGVAVETKASGRYRAPSDNADLLRAATGLCMRWGLEYEDVSVQQLLGSSRGNGAVRAPRARLQIYDHLLEHGEIRLFQLEDIFDRIGYKSPECVTRQAEVLEDLGIVDINIPVESDPILQITDYHSGAISNERSALIVELAETLPPGTRLTLDDFLKRFTHRISRAELVEIRHQIICRLNISDRYANLSAAKLPGMKASCITLNKAVRAPIEELTDGFRQLREDGPTSKLIRFMHTVLSQPDGKDFGTLLAKGRVFSTTASKDNPEVLQKKIISLIPKDTRTEVTVRDIRDGLRQEHGKILSVIALRKFMNEMAHAGLLEGRKVERSSRPSNSSFAPNEPRMMNVYRLPGNVTRPKAGKRTPKTKK